MKKIHVTVFIAAAGLIASLGATSAHAAVTRPHAGTFSQASGTTQLIDRPDSGNAGNWASDYLNRTLTIKQVGESDGVYTFTATVKDQGLFNAVPGADTPDQSTPGTLITLPASGPMSGYADYSFTATSLPDLNHGKLAVPASVTGNADSTSTWYEVPGLFPSGTTFGGPGIGDWSWTYNASVVTGYTVSVRGGQFLTVPMLTHEQWIDAYNNGDGNLAADGNIS